jgi:hypothetical protein
MRRTAALCLASAILLGPAFTPPPAVAAPSDQPAASKVNLRPTFKKGQEVRFRVMIESSSDAAAGEKQTQAQEIGLLLRCTASDPESGTTLDLVYESLRMEVKSPLVNVSFDSKRPPSNDDAVGSLLRSIVGLTLPVTMDKDGNITAVGSGAGAGGLGGLSEQFTGADMVKSMFGPIMTTRKSAGEARVGESWSTQDTIDAPAGQINLTFTHTLDSHQGGKANISMKGKATLQPSPGGAAASKARIRDSSITGKTVWDTEAGMLHSLDSRQRLEVETMTEGQASVTTQDMTVKVSRVK